MKFNIKQVWKTINLKLNVTFLEIKYIIVYIWKTKKWVAKKYP